LVSKNISSHQPGEASDTLFFYPNGENRFSCARGSSISLGFGHSSIRRAQAIPAFRDALGDSGRKKCAGNGEETSRTSCGPDLSAREIGRRPHRLIFRASSSSPRIVFRAL
jgi:hypothetical protein